MLYGAIQSHVALGWSCEPDKIDRKGESDSLAGLRLDTATCPIAAS